MLAVAGQHHGADSSGSAVKNASMPCTVVSLSALRFSARASVSTATAPCRSAWSVGGSLANSVFAVAVITILHQWRHLTLSGVARK